jgi:hypothetical protein
MSAVVEAYLDEVRVHLHLDPRTEKRVISELESHFQEKVNELEEEGLPPGEAERLAVASFGTAKAIARLMYQAYGRGSWMEALISCQPHIIAAVLFATHFWRHPILLGAACAAFMLITVLGWRKVESAWLYSWAGYSVFPLLVVGYLSRNTVAGTVGFLLTGSGSPAPVWQLAAACAFYAFAIWLVATSAVRVARRDWIFLSLLLLPLPVLGIWAFSVDQVGEFFLSLGRGQGQFTRWDSSMAYFSVILAVTSVVFVRARRRSWKAGAVLVIGIGGGALAVRSIRADMGLISVIALSLCMMLILLSPLLLRSFFAKEHAQKTGLADPRSSTGAIS